MCFNFVPLSQKLMLIHRYSLYSLPMNLALTVGSSILELPLIGQMILVNFALFRHTVVLTRFVLEMVLRYRLNSLGLLLSRMILVILF